MKVKTSELNGAALDWAVAKIENTLGHYVQPNSKRGTTKWEVIPQTRRYCTNWAQGGPIIEREQLEISPHFWTTDGWHWVAYVLGPNNQDENYEQRGPTSLIAAMRCYVASKLGETVDIPEELI